jgi:hypothetical protein
MSDHKPPAGDILKLLHGGGDADKHAELMRRVEKEWPREVELAGLVARMAKTRFDALKAQGFADGQALQLTMRWMWPSA